MYNPSFVFYDHPFPWADFSGSLPVCAVHDLCTTLECFPFREVHSDSDSDKTYSFLVCSLVKEGKRTLNELPYPWEEFVRRVSGPEYEQLMRDLFDLRDVELYIDIEIFKYLESDWIGPHTDRADRLVTHLFYLNEAWDDDAGGILHLLTAPCIEAVAFSIVPIAPTSIAFARSNRSWHYVSPVLGNVQRLSIRIDLKRKQ